MRVIVTPAGALPPVPIDAVVLEEDTCLVLSAARDIVEEPAESVQELLEHALEMEPLEPGSVIVRGGCPLRLLAVVHDLDGEPTWHEEWIAAALAEVLREAAWRGVESLALPVLGAVHGGLPVQRFAELLAEALRRVASTSLDAIWIELPPGTVPQQLSPLSDAAVELEIRE